MFKIHILDKNVKKLDIDYKSAGGVCFDLPISGIEYSSPSTVTVRFGFGTSIPKGHKAIIVPRSSFCQKGWIMQNSPAQIDSDYRGEWMAKFEAIPSQAVAINTSPSLSSYSSLNQIIDAVNNNMLPSFSLLYPPFPYSVGDRICQAYIEPVYKMPMEFVDSLDETERGSGGFGSTGT